MPSEAMSEALVRFGLPLFWLGLGVVQWVWPAAIFTGLSNDAVTPGARGFAVLWLFLGSTFTFLFVPQASAVGGYFVPGSVLFLTGVLQRIHPVWASPVTRISRTGIGTLLAAGGLLVLGFPLL